MNSKKIELKEWIKCLFNKNKKFTITPDILIKFIISLKEIDTLEFKKLIDNLDNIIHFTLRNSYYYETYIENFTVHLINFEKYIQTLLRKIFGVIFMSISYEYLMYNNEYTRYKYLNDLRFINNDELVEFVNLINKYTLFTSLDVCRLKKILQYEKNNENMISYLLYCNIHDYDRDIERSNNFIKQIRYYKTINPQLEIISESHKRKLCNDYDNNYIEIQDPLKTLKEMDNELNDNMIFVGTNMYYITSKK
jgi:hypothetical protein